MREWSGEGSAFPPGAPGGGAGSSEEGGGGAGTLRALGLRRRACGSRCCTGREVRLFEPGGKRNPTAVRHERGEGGGEVRGFAGTLALAH